MEYGVVLPRDMANVSGELGDVNHLPGDAGSEALFRLRHSVDLCVVIREHMKLSALQEVAEVLHGLINCQKLPVEDTVVA